MTSVISIFANDLNEQLIRELKSRFGNTRLDIAVADESDYAGLPQETFWTLIDLLAWDQPSDQAIVNPLIMALQTLDAVSIYQFEAYLSRALYDLDTAAHAAAFSDGLLSVDDFLYARAAVVANGKGAYELVVARPSEMPTEVTFEPILYAARSAYKGKTGQEMNYVPLYSYETYSNTTGWSDRKKG